MTMKAGKSWISMRQIASMPQLGVLVHVDLLDAVVGEPGGGAADRAEVEAAVPPACLAHLHVVAVPRQPDREPEQ